MATSIDNDHPIERSEREVRVERTVSDSSGWAVALIILLLVIAGGIFFWMRYRAQPAATPSTPTPNTGSANINVTLPAGSDSEGGAAE